MTLLLISPLFLLAQGAPGLDPSFFQKDPRTVMVACADKARAAVPKDSRSLAEFGRIYLMAGEKVRALEAFKRAEELGSRDATTHSLIAQAWLLGRDKAAALAAANRMAELAPRNATLLARVGVDFTTAGFLPEGRNFMDRAYKLAPSDWQMSLAFGKACLAGGQGKDADFWFRRTLTGRIDDDKVWKAVGLAYADGQARPRPSQIHD
jgi:Flp pilus assembly protein TadD